MPRHSAPVEAAVPDDAYVTQLASAVVAKILTSDLIPMLAKHLRAELNKAELVSPAIPEPGYRVQQAADRMGISDATLERMISSGEIDSYRLGRARIIPKDEVDRFIVNRFGLQK